ncbi:amidohydrolase family protein [Crassaminicella profunda]|uniref:amidohydrolase family protein n=1 Tax=Crassaminicella profunda TaxID=1286698 RepID=UPI001CA74637|nr:amidohydrolase family protein [Crassaminicella profunda]QZY54502.1 amidohydrolase family protein [Crassaminicella profunda]
MDTIKIINGKIPDFNQRKFVQKDIFIKEGKIVEVGQVHKKADEIIDAQGKIVSPGFIDIHMHEENLVEENYNYDITNYMLNMGVTTCAGGNCGLSKTPLIDFMSFVEEKGAPTNYIMFTGYNSLREEAGYNDRYAKINSQAVGKIKKLIERDIRAGAAGMSFGIEYAPGISFKEMVEASLVIPNDDYLLSAHYRYDEARAKEAMDEMIEIAKETKIPFQISHLGSGAAFGFMDSCLDTIRRARNDKIDIMADCYPYEAFCTHIGSAVFDEGFLERWHKEYKDLLLTQPPFKNQRCTPEIFQEARKNHPNMLTVAFVMEEKEVIQALKEPFVMVASDGIYVNGQGHPRGAGTFPRVLGYFVREKNTMELIDALEKMTKIPAQRLKLFQKGEIKEGMDADITIFDDQIIIDQASFEEPTLKAQGLDYVLVNGKIAMEKGSVINYRSGKIIKRI